MGLAPGAKYHLFAGKKARSTSGKNINIDEHSACIGSGAAVFSFHFGDMDLNMVESSRGEAQMVALMAATPQQRGAMNIRRLLRHPRKRSTRTTAKQSGFVLTGKCMPHEERSKAKPHAYPVPKKTSTKASKRPSHVEVDLMGPMKHPMVGSRHYTMIVVEYFTSIAWFRILRNPSEPEDQHYTY